MFSTNPDITKPAIYGRLLLIFLQFLSNLLIDDHNANVFIYPKPPDIGTTDLIIDKLLGGFVRWDSQYFLHISIYTYTYENSLAFFPLLPFLTKTLTHISSPLLLFISIHSLTLITYVILNLFLFVYTAKALYALTEFVFDKKTAFKCALLFCVNPASIFFSAPYTESLFAFLTFNAILQTFKIDLNKSLVPCVNAALLVGLSGATRSNGLLNLGFLIYFYSSSMLKHRNFLKHSVILLGLIAVALLPFILVQYYYFSLFCTNFQVELPESVLNYGKKNHLILPGEHFKHNQTWCNYNIIPMSYSYVQNKYWNVGFLKYYEFKQLPNFLLAAPIIYIILSQGLKSLNSNKDYLIHLGIFKPYFEKFCELKKIPQTKKFDKKYFYIFPCVLHCVALGLFCVFFVHIQVSTRMLCSASPAVYWFSSQIDKKWIKYYYCSYFVLGTIMFCNFLPWT